MTQIKVKPEDAIESLVKIVGGVDAEIASSPASTRTATSRIASASASTTEPKTRFISTSSSISPNRWELQASCSLPLRAALSQICTSATSTSLAGS
jgi:hypothetical protein